MHISILETLGSLSDLFESRIPFLEHLLTECFSEPYLRNVALGPSSATTIAVGIVF